MVIYDSFGIYLQSKKSLREKIHAIEGIIDNLEIACATAALNEANGTASTFLISELDLDSGQSKMKAVYRSAVEVGNAIEIFKRLLQSYINRYNGRKIHLIDEKNFLRPFYGNFRG